MGYFARARIWISFYIDNWAALNHPLIFVMYCSMYHLLSCFTVVGSKLWPCGPLNGFFNSLLFKWNKSTGRFAAYKLKKKHILRSRGQIFTKFKWLKYCVDFHDIMVEILMWYRRHLVHIWLIYDWCSPNVLEIIKIFGEKN